MIDATTLLTVVLMASTTYLTRIAGYYYSSTWCESARSHLLALPESSANLGDRRRPVQRLAELFRLEPAG